MSSPNEITVTVSGAAGQIGYALLPLLANGRVFGPSTRVNLRLLDINMGTIPEVLAGVKMELEDGAYPTLGAVDICIADLEKAFTGCDVAVLVGGFPRKAGMERKDLIAKNCGIFGEQGKAIEAYASKNIKVVVIANPANTNCLILKSNAPSIPAENFSALTFLDHNRARGQLALKLGVSPGDIRRTCIWGNHSSTQVPDADNGTVAKDGAVTNISDSLPAEYLGDEFITTVAKRGAAVIAARKMSSAMSAANAVGDHLRTWLVTGTDEGDFCSLAIVSDGSYGIEKGLIYSFPVTCKGDGTYEIVQGLTLSDAKQELLKKTEAELKEEKADADAILAGSA